MFADKNPIQLSALNGRQSKNIAMQQAFENGVVMRLARDKSHLTGIDLHREKSIPFSVSPTKSFTEMNREEFEGHTDVYEYQVCILRHFTFY